MVNIITNIFNAIQETISNFFDVINSGIGSVVELFYKTTTEGSGEFTFLGTVLLIGLGVGLVWTLIKWISGLVRNVAR